jgi:hypothetical protein
VQHLDILDNLLKEGCMTTIVGDSHNNGISVCNHVVRQQQLEALVTELDMRHLFMEWTERSHDSFGQRTMQRVGCLLWMIVYMLNFGNLGFPTVIGRELGVSSGHQHGIWGFQWPLSKKSITKKGQGKEFCGCAKKGCNGVTCIVLVRQEWNRLWRQTYGSSWVCLYKVMWTVLGMRLIFLGYFVLL